MAKSEGPTTSFSSAVYNGFVPERAFGDAASFFGAQSGSDIRTNSYFNTASNPGAGFYITAEDREKARAKQAAADLALIEAVNEEKPTQPFLSRIVDIAQQGFAFASLVVGPDLKRYFQPGNPITYTPPSDSMRFNQTAQTWGVTLTSPLALNAARSDETRGPASPAPENV